MAAPRSRVIIVGAAILLIGSCWRAAVSERKRHRLNALAQQLKTERASLRDELKTARETIEGQTDQLSGLERELTDAQQRLSQTRGELASLRQAYEQARQRNETLAGQLGTTLLQRQQLEAKLSSLSELRLAIREIKRTLWQQRVAAWQRCLHARQRPLASWREGDRDQLVAGNRGYVMRNGLSTLGAAPRMHVHVLEPQSQ